MPVFEVTVGDGVYEVDAPLGVTQSDIWGAVANQMDPIDRSVASAKNDAFGAFLRGRAQRFQPGESEDARNRRLYGGFDAPDVGTIEGAARSALQGGTFGAGDEIVAAGTAALDKTRYPDRRFADLYRSRVGQERAKLQGFRESDPALALGSEIVGAVPTAMLTAPRVAQAGPLAQRLMAGGLTGGVQGGVYGFNATDGDLLERTRGAGIGAGVGTVAGVTAPAVGAGAKNTFNAALGTGRAARDAKLPRPVFEMLSEAVDADNIGGQGARRLTNLGDDAMLADAGRTTAGFVDYLSQRPGPGQRIIGDALQSRVGRATGRVTAALDDALGRPGESSSRALIVHGDKTNPLNLIYKRAYEKPINYAGEQGRRLEELLLRVPARAIRRAQELMDIDGDVSKQVLANIADDGTVTFNRLPDVRQIDYITRALNDEAFASAGQGALGGKTQLGGALSRLSGEIRSTLKEAVPEYKAATGVAADMIRAGQARDFGGILLSPRTTRAEVIEMLAPMGDAELRKVQEGLRQSIDDTLARVKTAFTDPNMDAREAAKAIKDLSSRASRDKLSALLGGAEAGRLFRELDNASTAFQLRASAAQNSKTAARQMFNERFDTTPGALDSLRQGQPLEAARRLAAIALGRSPVAVRQINDRAAADAATALVGRRGAAARDLLNRLQQGQTVAAPSAERVRSLAEMLMRANTGVTGPAIQR